MQVSTEPQSVQELLERTKAICGLTFGQLAARTNLNIPPQALRRKGWGGMAIEAALGAKSGSKSQPDFVDLGIELKTLPINHTGRPAESTFITSIPLLTIHQQTWLNSQCYAKLRRILWVPVEDDPELDYAQRRIGEAILWSPSADDLAILQADWEELTWLIGSGKLHLISAHLGKYLQIRPKAANSKSLCFGYDEHGQKFQTMPRGFYLRSAYTASILK